MRKSITVLITLMVLGSFSLRAQLGFTVAKSKIGSSLEYALVFNEGYQSEYLAKKSLKSKGYQRVYNLNGGSKRGHNLKSGFYVVIKAQRKSYLGKRIVSYGLGASEKGYQDALNKAISNLRQYDWAWRESHGYEEIERGSF